MSLASQAFTAAQWPRERYEQAIHISQPRRVMLILEEQTVILAFLIVRAIEHEWELENIAVANENRRRGFGSRILGELLSMAKQEKADAVFLEVRESNRAARAFYEKWTFHETGRRSRYYSQPEEDAIVYRLALR